jgi:SAM-dependent methyltransferase
MIVRDKQAGGYLEHAKLPTQVSQMRRFIAALRPAARPVLDLGCGPGPSTQMLIEHGFQVVAVDFSRRSLELNKAKSALFVQADLKEIRFFKNSVDGLMMADFLQHLGDLSVQKKFLHEIFESLTTGGWFYLSVFNANIKNRLRRDIDGSFANGQIRYIRLTPADILKILPPAAAVESVRPMNVFHRPKLDDLVSGLPLARLIARMIVISGRKH